MTPSDLITEGSSLMLFGMGFVFLFLSLLVLVTSLMSKIITRFFPEPSPSGVSGSNRAAIRPHSPVSSTDQTELVAAISAAIRLHRTKNRK
ncbi:OadG family protein [Endozoicomonas sp.]|uniref:OadG family protein n=1 Tax=Endozoicomonas sp. TaxID=1892382 RepID=UPI002884AAE1|nr:OadG family transporter subunit [Endozoicomonas sp.]